MPPPFRQITLAAFDSLLQEFPFQRRINAVHMHHTWRPNRAQYRGHDSIVGMWRYHTVDNGWRDIAQHLTIGPDGSLWLGRNWNQTPVSATGHNGSAAAGPFMFEMVGDFDRGRDPFEGPQRDAALRVIALVQRRFDLPVGSLRFHNQMSPKSCPGTAISYAETLAAVQALRDHEGVGTETLAAGPVSPGAAMGDAFILLGDDDTAGAAPAADLLPGDDAAADAPADTASAPPADPLRAAPAPGEVQDLILALLRGDRLDALRPRESADAELPEGEGPAADAAVPGRFGAGAVTLGGTEAPWFGPVITTDMKEALRPHVINLSRGRFSTGGLFQTDAEDVDAIFGEDLERAVAGRDAANPLRLVIWAHGGLVAEAHGLQIAYKHVGWWNSNGVYPLYFVWETGLLEALGRLITGRSGGEEGVVTDRVTEFTDGRIEALARVAQGPAIWSDMKQSARLAVDPYDGGASYVARKLGAFCRRHPGAVELHAAGHSAGAIFHASFLPAAFDLGVPSFKTLALLAPAIRVDRFKERLAPHIGAGQGIERVALFTMNRLRELDDNCVRVYRKSLLYLIYHALEERPETPILGLELCLRADPALKALFGLGGAVPAAGEVSWSKTLPGAPPRCRSESISHGGFDDDAATMDSVLRRILDQDRIPRPYAESATRAGAAVAGSAPATDFIAGEEAPAPGAQEGFGVPFDVLDAFERVAEMTPDAAERSVFGLEVPAAPDGLTVGFGPNARGADVTAFSHQVLRDIMRRAGVTSVVISSTSRSPADQARVMMANLERFGVAHQLRLYGPAGDRVIEVYRQAKQAGRDAAAIKALMATEIVRVGPTRVSRHAADPRVLNVFDVAPSSVARRDAFEQAVRAERRVAKFLTPPGDPGYHLEIPQPQQG